MDRAKIRIIGAELAAIANRLHVIASESWKHYEQLKQQLDTADPATAEGKELELLVISVGRSIPGRSRATDLYNCGNALSMFPLSGAPGISANVFQQAAMKKEMANA